MQARHHTFSGADRKPSARALESRRQQASPLGRLIAALVMGLILLALSALIQSAAAAVLGGGWSSLGAIWLLAIIVLLTAVGSARTSLVAWRRMCLIDGVASLGLVAVGAVDLVAQRGLPDLPLLGVPVLGPVLGVALASGMLAIAGLTLALLFLAVWYLLWRHRSGSDRHAS